MRFSRSVRTWHRWLGWAVGIQVVLWLVSGLTMSLLASDEVRSEHLRRRTPLPELSAQDEFLPARALIAHFAERGVQLSLVTLRTVADHLAYEVTATDGAKLLLDARSGEFLSPIDGSMAERIAAADRASSEAPTAVELLQQTDSEYRGDTPVWRLTYQDTHAARIYVSPVTGEVVGRTNRLWRLHDLMWMLHIMDYDERSDYNNPLLRVVAGLGVLLAFTGVGVLLTTPAGRRR